MSNTDKLQEIAFKWGCRTIPSHDFTDDKYEDKSNELLSDLTTLISEHYVAKEEVDKMVEEMRQKLFSMRATKKAMDELESDDKMMQYGYHDCINEMLMWTKSREK